MSLETIQMNSGPLCILACSDFLRTTLGCPFMQRSELRWCGPVNLTGFETCTLTAEDFGHALGNLFRRADWAQKNLHHRLKGVI